MIEPAPLPGFEYPPIKVWVYQDTLRCAIYPAPLGSGFNGYVQLPPNAPDRTVAEAHAIVANADREWGFEMFGYDALDDIDVHGTLTYGPDEQGWVGFDTGHAFDDWSDEELERWLNVPEYQHIWQHVQEMWRVIGHGMWPPGRISKRYPVGMETNWTMTRLEHEVEHLAAQVYERLHREPVRGSC